MLLGSSGLPTWPPFPQDLRLSFPGVGSWITGPYLLHLDPRCLPVIVGSHFSCPSLTCCIISTGPPVPIYTIPSTHLIVSPSPPMSCPLLALVLWLRLPLPSISCPPCGAIGGWWYIVPGSSNCEPFVLGSGVLPRTRCPPLSDSCIPLDTNCLVGQNAP
jgi:hypothetical protein